MVEITIDTENREFESGEALELAHTLQDLADELSRSGTIEPRDLRDSGGVKIGRISFDVVKLTKVVVAGGAAALAVAGFLHYRGAYYSMMPLPDDQYRIEYKPEHADAVAQFLAKPHR